MHPEKAGLARLLLGSEGTDSDRQRAADATSCCSAAADDVWAQMTRGAKTTNLLHDAGLALGEGDVAARLVANELDLDLAALAAALVVVVIVVVGSAGAGALDAATLDGSIAIADGMRVVKVVGRGVVVLVSDVGHFAVRVSRKTKKVKWWRCCFERCADGLDLIWR